MLLFLLIQITPVIEFIFSFYPFEIPARIEISGTVILFSNGFTIVRLQESATR
jgi:hypothetical protein